MDKEKILKNVIKSFSDYNAKQKSFKRIFLNEPVMSKAIEVFYDEMVEMLGHIFDLLEIPREESDKDRDSNWTRDICFGLIKIAANNEKYVEPTIELVLDWKNLNDYTSRVETHNWFHFEELLDEHLTGYKKWYEKQQKRERSKKSSV